VEAVFRRSFWDPSISIPCLTLLIFGLILLIISPTETMLVAVSLIILGLIRAYMSLRTKYVISQSSIKVFKGANLIKEIPINEIKRSQIRIRGGKVRDLTDTAIASTLLITGRGPGLPTILDIGTVEFVNPDGEVILRVKGVKIGGFIGVLRDFLDVK